jgi:hypothetical protein
MRSEEDRQEKRIEGRQEGRRQPTNANPPFRKNTRGLASCSKTFEWCFCRSASPPKNLDGEIWKWMDLREIEK